MKPNVIVFFTDQQRWDSTGLAGNPLDLTPNFDRMAREGTHAPRAFTMQPVCGPARACLQTGMYASRNGCVTNGIPVPTGVPLLGESFRNAGYQTAYIGKWHLGDDDHANPGPVKPSQRGGYDYWLASNILEFTSDAYQTTLYDNENKPVHLPGYRVDACTDAAIRYVDQHKADPFFLFLSFIEPHHQNHRDDYPAPTGYEERYRGRWTPPDLAALGGSSAQHLAGYWGMIKRLDEALGRLLDALKSQGILDNTIVVFTSDHGCHFKTRNPEYKRSCHDSSIRVPLALRGPGFDGGGSLRQMVSLIDLPPTLLDAAGIDVPATFQGRSILPLLRGQPAEWPDDVYIEISESQCGRAIRTGRWKYGVDAPDAKKSDACAARYAERYLYDLDADPYELRNLIGSEAHAPVAARMRQRLLGRMKTIGAPECEIEAAPLTIKRGQRKVSAVEVDA
jgi:arylsulfatase A-like enzyme